MTHRIFIVLLLVILAGLANAQTFEISPPDNFVFDCNQGVEYVTFSTMAFAIDTEELILTCNGETFDTSSDRFSEVFLGVQFELPLESYMPNDTINLCLHNLEDFAGTCHYDSICWQYFMEYDNIPPSFEFADSSRRHGIKKYSPGDTIYTFNVLMFLISDSSGIDTTSITFTIEDSIFYHDRYILNLQGDTLIFTTFRSNFRFPEGDSMIDICIHFEDLYEPCPNVLDTCFQLYLAPRDYCPCNAGFYIAGWRGISSEVSTPITMVIDSLSVKYEYFKLDEEYYVMDPCSMDVYYVQPWHARTIPDSMISKLHDYVYNGGILYLWSECTGGFGSEMPFLYKDDEWFLGMEPRATHALGSTGDDCPDVIFSDHPIVPEIDRVKFDWSGSIKLTSNAVKIGGTDGYSYFHPHTDLIDEYEPTVIAMSHYGRGTVFLHMDYTSMRYGIDYDREYLYPDNMSINYDLPCCKNIPKFFHYPDPGTEFNCQNDTFSITTEIIQFGTLDPESLNVVCNGHVFDTSTIYLDVYDSSFVFNIPPGYMHDIDTLFICINNIIDRSGYWYYDSICWIYTFNIDEDPPVIDFIEPNIGDTLSVIERFSFALFDLNDIDTMSVSLTFEEDYTYDITHASLWRYADTFYFDPSVAGISFGNVDTMLDICVHALDNNLDCTPFALDTCWQVYLKTTSITETQIPDDFELSVYPNPFNSICNIDGVSGEIAEIFDNQGHLIKTLTLPSKWNATDNEGEIVPSGTYIISVGGEKIAVKYLK